VPTVLDGIRVAAFTHFAAGPIAAQYLGALGADVIKVEAPQQDVNRYALRHPDGLLQGISPYFLVTNRNQRCLGLDLKNAEGLDVARRLIASSDVLLENYRPGVMDRLGLGYEAAKSLKPDIIYCSLSAYDPDGPARTRPGQDLLMQAMSGLASLSGRGDGPPVPVGAYIIDGFTAMQGVIGILGALRYRDRTGAGQLVRVDMMSASMFLMSQEASYVLNVDPNPQRSSAGIAHVHQSAPYGVYETLDGPIAISVFGGAQAVRKIADALNVEADLSAMLTEQGLRFHRDDVARVFARRLASLTRAEAIALLERAGAWVAPVRSLAEALADPAVVATGIIQEIDTAYGGRYRVIKEPLRMSASPLVAGRPAPAHGQHSGEVLTELVIETERTNALFASGAVFANAPG
jgi:crotonobetainyl-CoA:carnitine CoA-transferase CaiB-like acyl-CoA transferase